MTTIVEHAPAISQVASRPTTPPPHITLNTSIRGTPAAVPNKHIPVCSPGKAPAPTGLMSPQSAPATPVTKSSTTILSTPDTFLKLQEEPTIYSIEPSVVADVIEEEATRPLLESKKVFPWLHGLHSENAVQLAFFVSRRKSLRRIPKDLRGLTIVKAGGDLMNSRIKGAVTEDEILTSESLLSDSLDGEFIEADPKEGFSVRNFQIQTAKMATISDIIVYGDDNTTSDEVVLLANKIANAQLAWKKKLEECGWESATFNTFVVLGSFQIFEETCPNIVAINSKGEWTGRIVDFFLSERIEMSVMTKASEIAPNVYLGPTPDPAFATEKEPTYDVLIEANDLGQIPDPQTLESLKSVLSEENSPTVQLEVPGSGNIMPPTWTHKEVDGLLDICQWIWDITGSEVNAGSSLSSSDSNFGSLSSSSGSGSDFGVEDLSFDEDGDLVMNTLPRPKAKIPRKVLIHCADGYTESSLLAITYFMFAHGLSVSEAWIRLHREVRRNFFAYPTDVALLTSIQPRIMTESPVFKTGNNSCLSLSAFPRDPTWIKKLDGSLPSRVLDYMYLGNLGHANNPALLKELGIGRIVSVGEKVNWLGTAKAEIKNLDVITTDGLECLMVDNVQDNGMDSLTEETIERCLEFIEKGKNDGIATLVHCRVGVSRSATICIAEVMKEHELNFPRAYCFVRARRLNVIIQPHLRFTYELLKWEETLRVRRGEPLRRELEWATVAREIAAMNRPYSR